MAAKLLLPSENARTGVPDQGWTVKTEVKLSGIPGAGNGRYSVEAIPDRTRVCVKPVAPMNEITSLLSLPADRVITFASEADLEKYIALAKEEGGYTREQVLDQFENFIWGLDEARAALNNSTWSMNHGEGKNETVVFQWETQQDGTEALVGDANGLLAAGTEFYNSYRDFVIPVFYRDWCTKQKISDVRSLVLRIVDGTPHVNDPPRLPGAKVGFGPAPSA